MKGLQRELELLERTDPKIAAAAAKYDAAVAKILATPINTLSLRQPWGWLVVHGGKRIENRRWNTRFRGSFLIHAAKGMTRAEYDGAVAFACKVDPALVVPLRSELQFGGIVGRARLVDVIAPCELTRDDPFGTEHVTCGRPWHMHDQYGFLLEDVEPLPFRPLRGALGFFDAAAQRKEGV